MKLLNDFFKIVAWQELENGFKVNVVLNASHIIYQGHFPGHPLTPAVIQLRMVHELSDAFLQRTTQIQSMAQSKFLKMVDPSNDSNVLFEVGVVNKEGAIHIRATGFHAHQPFLKVQFTLI